MLLNANECQYLWNAIFQDVKDKYGTQNSAEATIIVRRNKEESIVPTPKFGEIHYIGKYTSTHEIELPVLTLTTSDPPNLDLQGGKCLSAVEITCL